MSQGRICSDNSTCCHTEIEVADQTFYLNQSQYTDTGPTSPSADPIMPGAWQGSHWSAKFKVTGMTRPGKIPSQAGFEPGIFRSRGGRLTTRPTRRFSFCDLFSAHSSFVSSFFLPDPAFLSFFLSFFLPVYLSLFLSFCVFLVVCLSFFLLLLFFVTLFSFSFFLSACHFPSFLFFPSFLPSVSLAFSLLSFLSSFLSFIRSPLFFFFSVVSSF